ncbi:MAG: hypothetical protein RIR11_81 [Bacteroidota bacterium]|jgi:hypothetical protein
MLTNEISKLAQRGLVQNCRGDRKSRPDNRPILLLDHLEIVEDYRSIKSLKTLHFIFTTLQIDFIRKSQSKCIFLWLNKSIIDDNPSFGTPRMPPLPFLNGYYHEKKASTTH